MKIVNTGNMYDIYDDSLKVLDKLEPCVYSVYFHEKTGFHLSRYSDIEIKESKIYGVHEKKVDKVLAAFAAMNRNLGVILSGDKGIGKSLFAKLLMQKGNAAGIPVIIVDKYNEGIASFLEEIDQEVIVMFDEFDKTFGGVAAEEGKANAQTEMLTLFDGMSQGKKLFVVTCNELRRLSEYLVNRPGRFHYHFRFEYPTEEETKEYLQDKLEEAYHGEIGKVVTFSKKVNLNYDCLRAICTELNTGESFEEAIKDLNIVNTDKTPCYVTLYFDNGKELSAKDIEIDFFDPNDISGFWVGNGKLTAYVKFYNRDIEYDPLRRCEIVQASKINIDLDFDYCSETEEAEWKEAKLLYMTLVKEMPKALHYTL